MTTVPTRKNLVASPVESVPLIAADKALLSLRSSGHDYTSAVGEVIDNSLQANANTIRCRVETIKKKIGSNKKSTEVVDRIAFGDDGDGMDFQTLHNCLKLGFSSRYNDRKGMGRFGVGAKMGAISQCKRVEVWSRERDDTDWLYTHIDLDDIEAGEMATIPAPTSKPLPEGLEDLPGAKGTLVVWSKADRLAQSETGGGRRADTVRTDLVNYIARTFRKFLDRGVTIEFDGAAVLPHDPLYLMTSTRFHQGSEPDPVAPHEWNDFVELQLPNDPSKTAKVHITMTLLPKEWRRVLPGDGRSQFAKDRRIDENEGFSILRADREIFVGYLPKIQPSQEGRPIDRFIGMELRFEPLLDEYFHVRNVKKGAEPIEGLRDQLREKIFNTIKTLRKQVSDDAKEYEKQKAQERGVFSDVEQLVADSQRTSRKPRAGRDTSAKEVEEKIDQAAESVTRDAPPEEKPQRKQQAKERLKAQPYNVVPETWPGQELFVVEHLGVTTIVKMNMSHEFYTEVYGKVLAACDQEENAEVQELGKAVKLGFDMLVAGYAKAEGQFEDTTEFEALRTNWGLELRSLIQQWRKSHN